MGRRIFRGWTTPDSFMEVQNSIFAPHARVGFVNNPAFRGARMVAEGHERVFAPSADAQGFRITRPRGSAEPEGPSVWLYGCSYTWGWALADEHVFAWLLQAREPRWDVRNFGCGGHGTTQNLLLLTEHLDVRAPAAVVFNYFHGHIERSAATPALLNQYNQHGGVEEYAGWLHPRAGLDDSGNLQITYVPLVDAHLPFVNPATVRVDDYYQRLVLKKVMTEAVRRTRARGATFVLAMMEKQHRFEEELMRHVAGEGGVICDMRAPLHEPQWCCHPVDAHPNEKAHALYAARLHETLLGCLARAHSA